MLTFARKRDQRGMSDDNEIEDVSFLPGTTATNKRAVYEPKGVQRCKQLVCSKGRAGLIVACVIILILLVALIASFARPLFTSCQQETAQQNHHVVKPTEATATNGEKFPWTDIRLPKNVLPVSYDILLHPNLTTLTFNGSISIVVDVTSPTNFIILHVTNLSLNSHRVIKTSSNENIPITKILEYTTHQQLYIGLSRTLEARTQYTVMMKFGAPLSSKLMGFYKSSYTNNNGEKRYLATTQFEPTSARAAFPCFDEPAMKATFTINIVRSQHYKALSNMPVRVEDPMADGIVVDRFEKSVKMSTYLVAFVVCDYSFKRKKTKNNITVSVYAPPDQISQVDFALEAAVKVLDYYENFFGVPYPLPKQDLIAIPDFSAGAMENWGLITYRMTAILYDKEVSSAHSAQWVATVIAHELAHQWFGNLVTMKWWNDLWLNEGFASFVEFIGADQVNPDWKMLDQFIINSLQKAMSLDALSHSHPISVTVENPDQISEIFDAISYDKGSSIIRMLQQMLGEDVLKNGLKLYLKKYKYSNAETKDLWNSFTEAGKAAGLKIDVKQVMDTWTLQMGFPVVTVTKGKDNKYIATQKRFLLNPTSVNEKPEFISPYGYRWHVPLTYITEKNPKWNKSTKMMNMEQVAFDVKDGSKWIKANVEQKGFYRVNYDKENWNYLINQLKQDHEVFTPADRSSLINDAFAFAQSGILDIQRALDLSQYLRKDKDFVPWRTGLDSLRHIGYLLADKPVYDNFQAYMKKIMNPLLTDYFKDWSKIDSMSALEKFLASDVLDYAVEINHEASREKALDLFRKWMNNNVSISPILKKIVYRAGIMYGGDKEWKYCWKMYKATNVPSEKMSLLYAMTTTTNSLRINRFLIDSLDSTKIRSQDTVSVVTHISQQPAGRQFAWRFIQLNWNTFSQRYRSGSFEMSRLILRTVRGFSTEMEYKEVKNFFETVGQAGSGKRAIQQGLESIQMNIDWLSRNQRNATTWLKAHAGTSSA